MDKAYKVYEFFDYLGDYELFCLCKYEEDALEVAEMLKSKGRTVLVQDDRGNRVFKA